MNLVLLLCDKVANQRVALKNVRVNDFIGRRYVNHDVSDHVDQQGLRLCAKFDSGSIQEPLHVHEHVLLGQLAQHEFELALYLERHEVRNVRVTFTRFISFLLQEVLEQGLPFDHFA